MNRKMPVTEFGDRLIQTMDLDPAYVGLRGAALGRDQLCRWLLAYWCFYHVGAASYLSEMEGRDFWDFMLIAAKNSDPDSAPNVLLGNPNGENAGNKNERWPRAAERRHFRGQKCVDAVLWLSAGHMKDPEYYVGRIIDEGSILKQSGISMSEKNVMNIVQTWPMFGPWIAFKAADMLERVAGVPIKFDPNLGLMYEEPRAALDILVAQDELSTRYPNQNAEWWYNNLSMHFRKHLAPPGRDRTCGPQELETVLCKWKSYMGGHYHIGKDIHEHRGALKGWGSTAASMLAAMPAEVSEKENGL